MRRPGIEPGSTAWKAAMLTTIPPTLDDYQFWYVLETSKFPRTIAILNLFKVRLTASHD